MVRAWDIKKQHFELVLSVYYRNNGLEGCSGSLSLIYQSTNELGIRVKCFAKIGKITRRRVVCLAKCLVRQSKSEINKWQESHLKRTSVYILSIERGVRKVRRERERVSERKGERIETWEITVSDIWKRQTFMFWQKRGTWGKVGGRKIERVHERKREECHLWLNICRLMKRSSLLF